MRRLLFTAAVLFGCAAPPPATAPARPEPPAPPPPAMPAVWRVGAVLPLSGAEAEFGAHAKNGVELAIAQANEHGGASGHPVEIVYRDTHGEAADAAEAVRDLVEREHVVAIVGEVAASRSKAGGLVANRLGVPMITPTTTLADLGKIGPFVFRACVTDEAEGRAAARFVVEKLGKKRIALVYPLDGAAAKVKADRFREEAKRLGGEVVSDQAFLSMDTDYTPYLKAAQGAGAEVYYAPTFANQMVPLAKQASALGVRGDALVGADGWDDPARLREAGDALEGATFTTQYALDPPWAAAEALGSAYRARFADAPSPIAALSYDAARLVVDAIARAKSPVPAAIRDALASTSGFAGATGTTSFGAGTDPTKPVSVVKVEGGVARFFAEIR